MSLAIILPTTHMLLCKISFRLIPTKDIILTILYIYMASLFASQSKRLQLSARFLLAGTVEEI